MKARTLLPLVAIAFLITFSMCKKDDANPPYVGSWETDIFEDPASPVPQKITFEIEKSSFEAVILLQIVPGTFLEFLGLKGTIDEKDNQMLEVSLTDIGEWDEGLNTFDYKNRTANAAEFNALYGGYQLSSQFPLDFDGKYEIDGENLSIIYETIALSDTINLHKQ